MRHICTTLGRWFLIAAMMSAFGGHWVLLQSVAWTAMVFANAKHANLSQALEQTFDGRHPCPLCKSIEKGRQSEKKQDTQVATSKINFFYQTRAVALVSPREYWQQQLHDAFAQNRPLQPLLQPPRVLS
jgi:hypothetical protein